MAFAKFQGNRFKIDGEIAENLCYGSTAIRNILLQATL